MNFEVENKSDRNTMTNTKLIKIWNSNFLFILLASLILLHFTFLGFHHLNLNTNPEEYDTTAYLGESNLIRINGGIFNFVSLCLNGKYLQANQHPLYILLLSTFATRDVSFYVYAKITSFILGLLLLLVMLFLIAGRSGRWPALIASLGMALNSVFLKWSTLVACESLLILFCFLSIYMIIEGYDDNRKWIWAGIFTGLVFMTKGTGLFLIPGFIISTFAIYRLRIFRNKYFWLFFISFALVASPLLIRNTIVYNNPIYNVNLAKFSYSKEQLDESRYQIWNPNIGEAIHIYPEVNTKNNKIDTIAPQDFNPYVFIKGSILKLRKEAMLLFDALNIWPTKKVLSRKYLIVGNILLLFFLLIGLFQEHSGGRIYILSTLLTFLVCLTLYRPIIRYFLPIVPVIWTYIGIGIVTTVRYISKHFKKFSFGYDIESFIPMIIVLIIGVNSFYLFSHNNTSLNPFSCVEFSESRYDLLTWLRNNIEPGDQYVEGPNFNWQLDHGTWVLPPKNSRLDLNKFNLFAKKIGIKYVIIDWYSLTVSRYRGGGIDRTRKLKEYFVLDKSVGIIQKKKIDRWHLVYKDTRPMLKFMIFKLI